MLDPKTNLPRTHYRSSNNSKPSTYYPYNNNNNNTMDFGSRSRQTAQNYAIYQAGVGDDALKTRRDHEKNDTDEELSPSWRAREIERGRMELMEKVSSMPDSCYELSLKDIVENPTGHQGIPTKEQESHRESVSPHAKRQSSSGGGGSVKRRSDVRSQMMMRNGSIGSGGLLLKLVFPVPLGSSKSNSGTATRFSTSNGAKVSPRPSYSDESEKEWCRKTFSLSGEKTGKSSVAVGDNARNTKSSRTNKDNVDASQGCGSCWPFFWTKRSKLKS